MAPLLSDENFSVDGTLIEAWASMKSFKPKAEADYVEPPAGEAGSGESGAKGIGESRNAEVDFHGEKRSNDTLASVTDPDARLHGKGEGKEAKLCYMGHALMENRNGLVVEAHVTKADGHAERHAALAMHRRPNGTPATPSASVSAKGSRRRSAGARPSGQSPRLCYAASSASFHVHARRLQSGPTAQAARCLAKSRKPADRLRVRTCHRDLPRRNTVLSVTLFQCPARLDFTYKPTPDETS